MNNVIQFEDRVSRSRSKHEGESSAEVCDRLSRTRVSSQRQLPTDHDYAVPTREYQLDQSSPLPATAAADLVLEVQRQKQPQRFADIDRSHHINFRIAHKPGIMPPAALCDRKGIAVPRFLLCNQRTSCSICPISHSLSRRSVTCSRRDASS
jgi:hypothetical protein